jgi:hypothetical protein
MVSLVLIVALAILLLADYSSHMWLYIPSSFKSSILLASSTPWPTVMTNSSPWADTAPDIDTDVIPRWIHDYVDFHNAALDKPLNSTTDKNHYLIFTCTKSEQRCSGPGNRQRAIAAAFMIAVVTSRVLLIDIQMPVPLNQILKPHLLDWSKIPTHLWELPQEFLKVRNVNPAPMNSPLDFQIGKKPQVAKILANGPSCLDLIWEEFALLNNATASQRPMPHEIYKWIFYTLFRPSRELTNMVQEQLMALRLQPGEPYVGVHIRSGGEWGLKTDNREYRYTLEDLQRFLECGKNMSESNDTAIVIISDTQTVKRQMLALDQQRVRIVNTAGAKLVQVDKSKNLSVKDFLQVWTDVLILVRAHSLCLGNSTFGILARRIKGISPYSDRVKDVNQSDYGHDNEEKFPFERSANFAIATAFSDNHALESIGFFKSLIKVGYNGPLYVHLITATGTQQNITTRMLEVKEEISKSPLKPTFLEYQDSDGSLQHYCWKPRLVYAHVNSSDLDVFMWADSSTRFDENPQILANGVLQDGVEFVGQTAAMGMGENTHEATYKYLGFQRAEFIPYIEIAGGKFIVNLRRNASLQLMQQWYDCAVACRQCMSPFNSSKSIPKGQKWKGRGATNYLAHRQDQSVLGLLAYDLQRKGGTVVVRHSNKSIYSSFWTERAWTTKNRESKTKPFSSADNVSYVWENMMV